MASGMLLFDPKKSSCDRVDQMSATSSAEQQQQGWDGHAPARVRCKAPFWKGSAVMPARAASAKPKTADISLADYLGELAWYLATPWMGLLGRKLKLCSVVFAQRVNNVTCVVDIFTFTTPNNNEKGNVYTTESVQHNINHNPNFVFVFSLSPMKAIAKSIGYHNLAIDTMY